MSVDGVTGAPSNALIPSSNSTLTVRNRSSGLANLISMARVTQIVRMLERRRRFRRIWRGCADVGHPNLSSDRRWIESARELDAHRAAKRDVDVAFRRRTEDHFRGLERRGRCRRFLFRGWRGLGRRGCCHGRADDCHQPALHHHGSAHLQPSSGIDFGVHRQIEPSTSWSQIGHPNGSVRGAQDEVVPALAWRAGKIPKQVAPVELPDDRDLLPLESPRLERERHESKATSRAALRLPRSRSG